MTTINKYRLNKILAVIVWVLLCSGTVMLLVAAITKKNNEHCVKTVINISGVQNNFFIDKKDVLEILQKVNGGNLENKPIRNFDLASMEIALQKDKWIRKAELFFDNNDVLQVRVSEREPISRIFMESGASFYMDSTLKRLPLSDKFSARLPVFTNFPTNVKAKTKKDSSLLRQIKVLSEYIANHAFWMAQVEQIDITQGETFTLIPKLGNQIIDFGSANNYKEKFENLLTFYKQLESKAGWNMYSVIDVKYKGQVIGVRRGAAEIKADSLRTIQIMKSIIANAQKRSNDSSNIQLTETVDDNHSINMPPVYESPDEAVANEHQDKIASSSTETQNTVLEARVEVDSTKPPEAHSSLEKPAQARVKKQIIKSSPGKEKKAAPKKPRAVMPANSDYEN
ncbi:MAG: cell division protein FtsQ/DivIB [Bacteroidota bacterium]|nr:cell division protein FtsQ/DivIB [Bacteroidota bacterium]